MPSGELCLGPAPTLFGPHLRCSLSLLTHFLLAVLLSARACALRCFSRVRLFATLWAIAYQAPLFMGFVRQKYWSGLPCPPPGDLPDPGIELPSPVSPALAGRFFTREAPRKLKCILLNYIFLIIIPNCPPNCRSFKS